MKKLILIILLTYIVTISSNASIKQGISAFKNENLQLAKKLLLQEDNTDYKKHLYLAQIALKDEQLDAAEEYIDEAIKLNSKNAQVQFIYGEIMGEQAENANVFSLMGYIKKVKEALTTAVILAPQNIKYRSTLIQFHIHAPAMLGGDINEALKQALLLKKLNTLSGTNALIHVYGEMNNQEKFDQTLESALLNFVDEPQFHYQLGLYYQKQEQYDIALNSFRKAASLTTITNEQQNAKYSAIFQIGHTSTLSGRNLNEGEAALNQYLNEAVISSSMVKKFWAKFRLANIAEAKGEKEKAKKLYIKLIQVTTDKKLQKQVHKRIKKLS
ncbi:tetratricopeptide repeat protein [Pseudoalteromonas denitrificans]|uniref:Tetratricopeptide repeat-containing protein n=1 Tax=Pseudoalteromonas denitrificans DSM 6059 TaxID=1123010 RepID=A0A1I1J0A2_9GAMM|nr:hypothetical protein [Pseudoalteromonas denitrificans]SFC42019.1 Tetratricopeptide repeat-containing protein [Pseudoalteromonas denitrificans DSM 6059]